MLSPGANIMLARFMAVYGPPVRFNQAASDALIREYNRQLAPYSEPELSRAADTLIQARVWRNWPTIGEVVAVLKAQRAYLPPEAKTVPERVYTPEEIAEAERFHADCLAGRIHMGQLHKTLMRTAQLIAERKKKARGGGPE